MKKKYFVISCLALTGFLLAIVISGCCSCLSNKIVLCDSINPNSSTVIPVSRPDAWWIGHQEAINERVKQGNVDVIFFGDSITNGWKNEPQLWQQYFGKWQTVNAGINADRTQHVLWRIENGNLAGISPKVCVVMIGTNNSNENDNTAEEIADGIKAIVCKLRTNQPQAKILLFAIFPRGDETQRGKSGNNATYNAQWAKNDKASKIASSIADNKIVYYMNINDRFLDKDGILSRDMMPDLLHLSEKGYKIWGDAITSKIEELMAK